MNIYFGVQKRGSELSGDDSWGYWFECWSVVAYAQTTEDAYELLLARLRKWSKHPESVVVPDKEGWTWELIGTNSQVTEPRLVLWEHRDDQW